MDYVVSPKVKEIVDKMVSLDAVKKGLEFIKEDNDQTVQNQLDLAMIPSPTFHEQEKAKAFMKYFEDLGLSDVHMDRFGNVVGTRKGKGKGPTVLMEGHMDTVFPMDTKLEPKIENGVIHLPGIGDDTRGMVVCLTVARALDAAGIETDGDIVFVGTVEEEGMGSLGGMKKFLSENKIDASISVDGPSPIGITYEATGFKTYEATFYGIGGHAYGAFGKVANPLHAAARAVAKIADFQVPEDPRTTFCVSNFHAGSDASIHAIVPSATIKFNFRSNSAEELEKLNTRIMNALQEAADEETARWGKDTITWDYKQYCDVPAASQDPHTPIVEALYTIIKHLGYEPKFEQGGSTNCNMALDAGIPAVCLGSGGPSTDAHMLSEFFVIDKAYEGAQQAFLLALALAGVSGSSPSVME
ncbi:M20/M25/M40 family metallo-hydrolase [Merdimmobilis hominis]|uniref:Succinyl-diaminopimelate desuccinylase n=1 Tax=uncultured Anaerotruncus sp. TaxID=905011 RepID=A0A6N2STN6_9FIRM|nr:M20/M25/M40 family metallo-hydrolase [Merdimmobilis hominis]MCD4836139.1 M20/M25/M40 family metallo-hydrolase [Merdimmobilis hominis]